MIRKDKGFTSPIQRKSITALHYWYFVQINYLNYNSTVQVNTVERALMESDPHVTEASAAIAKPPYIIGLCWAVTW